MNNYFTEFIGTLFFIYIILYTKQNLAIGAALVILLMVCSGDYNPAITIMNLASGKYTLFETVPIILAQIAGGLVALKLVGK